MAKTQTKAKKEPKPKKQNKAICNPLDNRVSIKKLTNEKEITADFPLIKNSKGQLVMSIPVFRRDGLDYTPGFSLPDQFTPQFNCQQQALQEYRVNSENTQIPVELIKIPKPSSRNSYCTICKTRFEDYRTHIALPEHLTKMRESAYNRHIEEMCRKIRNQSAQPFLKALSNAQTSVEEPLSKDCCMQEPSSSSIFLNEEDESKRYNQALQQGDSKSILYKQHQKYYNNHTSRRDPFDVLAI